MNVGAHARRGIAINIGQFSLQTVQVFFVGLIMGMERTVLPTMSRDFGVRPHAFFFLASFVISFGLVKGALNFVAGDLSDRLGRKRVLLYGWLAGIPIPLLIALAPNWWWIIAANVFLGINQAFTWTMTVTEGGWSVIAPSSIPFASGHPRPEACRDADLRRVVADFAQAARRAHEAGFDVLELHMAHGYLLHEFLSPLANRREDRYGGPLENRLRLPLEVTEAVRKVWPDDKPLFVRISASDWVDGGWDIEQSLVLARELKARGVDLIDCSSGGLVADAEIPAGPGYQTPFATRIRAEAGIAVGAVGLITEPLQAEQIVRTNLADCVFLGRELLRDPYWPLHAAHALHRDGEWPAQYERARP
ncbi:MAG: MFS transporter [Gammaproteobacteria bacterium]|nr:MFS transporter [Gammaproteobacteria bacterium]